MNLDPGLLAAIIANPADDLPRLQMADWLDERGECERAEFIRVQVELARTQRWDAYPCDVCGAMPCDDGEISHGRGCFVGSSDGVWTEQADENPKWMALQARERELLATYRLKWCVNLPGRPPHVPAATWTVFTRGFPSEITCNADDWVPNAQLILASAPIERVKLMHVRANNEITAFYVNKNWPGIQFTFVLNEAPRWHGEYANVKFEMPQRTSYSRFIGEPGLV